MVRGARLLGLMLPLMTGMLGACAGGPPPLPSASYGVADTYRLGAGDKVKITVYNEPALSGDYSITAAGNLAFPLIGDVPAKGRLIEDVQGDLTAKLGNGYVKDPKVSIEPVNYRPYYILGEVNKPGEFPYSVNLTIEQAVAAAGGFSYRGNTKVAFVRRANQDAEYSVSLRGKSVLVLPGDTIRIGQKYF